jgi:hypothetical protein
VAAFNLVDQTRNGLSFKSQFAPTYWQAQVVATAFHEAVAAFICALQSKFLPQQCI